MLRGTSDGGGIYNAVNGMVNISSSTVKENTASNAGGGLYNEDGTINITASTFSDIKACLSGLSGDKIKNPVDLLLRDAKQ